MTRRGVARLMKIASAVSALTAAIASAAVPEGGGAEPEQAGGKGSSHARETQA